MDPNLLESFTKSIPENPASKDELQQKLADYQETLKDLAQASADVDIMLSTELIVKFGKLIEAAPDSQIALVDAAVAYLIEDDDEVPDTMEGGFDDDAMVFNHVCEECGLAELKVSWSSLQS